MIDEAREIEEQRYQEVLRDAEKGEGSAKTMLAWYKLSGCGGCVVDEDGAVEMLSKRVMEGDGEAMWMLGFCFEFGIGGKQDIEQAERLYQSSSSLKSPLGQFFAFRGFGTRGTGIMNSWWKMSSEMINAFPKVLKIAPWTKLNLQGNNIGSDYPKELGAVLVSHPSITDLNLSLNELKDAAMLGEIISSNTRLTSLDISKNLFEDEGAELVGKALKYNSSLTSLNLGGNGIGFSGVELIAEALKTNSSLTFLSIRENHIGEGVGLICKGLKNNTTLTSLDLACELIHLV